ncbi:hypothetical protein ABZ705_34130, partial [Streptomyces sp. NPDC006984]|uniref:hypothetical protein n=1 Tax=Streptomyces sp. NPDC006984 TaxID=3155463 RepID=UPI003410506B
MSADRGGEVGRDGLVGVEAGDRVDGLTSLLLAALLAAAVDPQGEPGVWEGDAAEVVVDPDGLDLDSSAGFGGWPARQFARNVLGPFEVGRRVTP